MQSKDVVLQVADETAEVMEEISEQLFDETDARFDEVIECIEKFCSDFAEYTNRANKQAKANQEEVLGKIEPVLAALEKLNSDSNGQAAGLHTKSDHILSALSEITQLLQDLSKDASSASDKCNSILEQLKASASLLQETNGKVLSQETANMELIKSLSVKSDAAVKELSGRIGEIVVGLEAVSSSMKLITEQQNAIIQKQAELEKDVQYLKLPFYKRWFTRG